MNRSALFGGWLYRNDVGYPGELDARGRVGGGERGRSGEAGNRGTGERSEKETTGSAVVGPC